MIAGLLIIPIASWNTYRSYQSGYPVDTLTIFAGYASLLIASHILFGTQTRRGALFFIGLVLIGFIAESVLIHILGTWGTWQVYVSYLIYLASFGIGVRYVIKPEGKCIS